MINSDIGKENGLGLFMAMREFIWHFKDKI